MNPDDQTPQNNSEQTFFKDGLEYEFYDISPNDPDFNPNMDYAPMERRVYRDSNGARIDPSNTVSSHIPSGSHWTPTSDPSSSVPVSGIPTSNSPISNSSVSSIPVKPSALAGFGTMIWKEWIRPIGEAVIIALVLTTFVFTTVAIDGASDEPNVHHGERVFVPKYETWLARIGIGSFKRGDLVVLKPPKDSPHSDRQVPFISNFFPNARYRPFFIKRIVGVPGDRIKLTDGLLEINGIKVNETHTVGFWRSIKGSDGQSLWDNTGGFTNSKDWSFTGVTINPAGEYVVPKGKYFAMGDNRSQGGSEDSRFFGPIALEEFAGRATFVWWSPVAKAKEIKAIAGSGAEGKSWWLYQHEKLCSNTGAPNPCSDPWDKIFSSDGLSLHFMMRPLARPEAFEKLAKELADKAKTP
jgi:signal peptidase I